MLETNTEIVLTIHIDLQKSLPTELNYTQENAGL